MKVSVSLSEGDLATVDRFASESGLRSRSAAIQHAIRLLGNADLEEAYAAAWDEWDATGEAAAWDSTVDDGFVDETR